MNVSRALLIAAALLACTPLFADNPPGTIGYNQWATCPIPASAAATHTPAPAAVSANAPTHVSADHLAGYVHGESLLSGNVHAAQGNRQMTAAQMQYNSTGGDTHASGNVHFVSPNMELRGPTADYNFNNSSGVFNDAEFSLPQRHGRGSAKLLKALDPDHDVLSDVHYTTCPVGSRDWMLN
ncbi:MAG: LPS-assembly protein LptD, partial [Gammaproteobacteria bacterium]|nr:LPS-assembly protein LptD [Gammaproteobacteria bacterium]